MEHTVKPETTGPESPEQEQGSEEGLILGKFKSQDDLVEAYKNLEKKLGAPKEEPAEPKAEKETPPPEKLEDLEITKKEVEEATGLDLDALQKEYAENGELTDETYRTLEERGIPRAMVDSYIEGQKAKAAQVTAELTGLAGGADALRGALDWAADNLSEEEVAAYNGALQSGNLAAVRVSLRGIVAAYREATGSGPNLVGGERAARSSGVQPFGSRAEITRAMQDPKYQTDEAYRQQVIRRLEVTEF